MTLDYATPDPQPLSLNWRIWLAIRACFYAVVLGPVALGFFIIGVWQLIKGRYLGGAIVLCFACVPGYLAISALLALIRIVQGKAVRIF